MYYLQPGRFLRIADNPRYALFGGTRLEPAFPGVSTEAILDDYPGLEPDDIRVCTAYAHAVIARDTLATISVAEP